MRVVTPNAAKQVPECRIALRLEFDAINEFRTVVRNELFQRPCGKDADHLVWRRLREDTKYESPERLFIHFA